MGSLGWSSTQRTSFAKGERMVDAGKWRRVVDPQGNHVGFQPLRLNEKPEDAKPGDPTPCLLTAHDMALVAGTNFKHGRSRTKGMSELQRTTRVHEGKMLPAEDAVELAEVKLQYLRPRYRA